MPRFYACVSCGATNLKPNNRKHITNQVLYKYVKKILLKDLKPDETICGKCYSKYYRLCMSQNQSNINNTVTLSSSNTATVTYTDPDFIPLETQNTSLSVLQSPKNIDLNLSSTSKSHRRCTVCSKEGSAKTKFVVVPQEAITQVYVEKNIFIDNKNRCCAKHLSSNYFTTEALSAIKITSNKTSLNRTDILLLLDNIRHICKTSGKLNFDIPIALSNEDYFKLTGVTKLQFDSILDSISSLRCTNVRSDRTCVAVLLVKLRTGLSNSILSTLFSLSVSQVQRAIHAARTALCEQYVPKHLGFTHISHDDFVSKHTTPIAKELFSTADNSAILVLDGTYIYIQKSQNHAFQRKAYSLQKGRPLLKPMMIVGSDGYILSIIGPYFADHKNNDAAITKHILLSNTEDINSWLCQDDIMIVDRGFRDCVEFLKEHGYHVEMPHFLPKGKKQHTTSEANESRLVTKVRWVVESANARIKQFRMFDKVVNNHLVPYIGDFLRIVCALCNSFRPALAARDPEGEVMAKEMLQRSKLPNSVQMLVESENLISRRSVYSELTIDGADSFEDFPKLSLDKLRNITLGVYQLKLAAQYTNEHLTSDGDYTLFLCKEKPNLFRVKIQSKHSNSVMHTLWIMFSKENIEGWYCTCKCGSRVVGCCGHIASVLWHLCYNRWCDKPASNQDKRSAVLCASDIPMSEDSDDSDGHESPMEEE